MQTHIGYSALLSVLVTCAAPASSETTPAGGNDDVVANACASLCSSGPVAACHDDPGACRSICRQRFGSVAGCQHAALELIHCHQQHANADCSTAAECVQQVADYAVCAGASACLTANNCQPQPPGCLCTMACADYTISAGCNPQTGICQCTFVGPLGYAATATDELSLTCDAGDQTNKWCISQPLGCCAKWF